MDSGQRRPILGENPLSDQISKYLESIEAGNYRRNVRSVLNSWAEWVTNERDTQDSNEITVLDCRRYARHLKQRTRNSNIKPSTAETYYATVRAFLSFCVDEEIIESNPAAVRRAVDELPEDIGDTDRQFWGKEERNRLLHFVDNRANQSLDAETDIDRNTAFRDRAIMYLLTFSGVRGGEVFSDPADNRRNGIKWSDLDLENGTLRVFGKSREYEYAQVPERAVRVLDRYRKVVDPLSKEWSVFPSQHTPSLYRTVRTQLTERSVAKEEIEALLDENDVWDVIRSREITPPVLSKNGARSLVQRLCEQANIEIEGEPLKLHGARRGLGHELYQAGHAELAQSALRHSSIEVTHDSYSNIQTSETAQQVDNILSKDSE